MDTLISLLNNMASRIAEVRIDIVSAAERVGRDPETIKLVAVTKGFLTEFIRELLDEDIGDIGESRVQEAKAKKLELGQLPLEVQWHLIGKLQSNKVGLAAELFDAIQTIESEKIALALNKQVEVRCDARRKLQVNEFSIEPNAFIPAQSPEQNFLDVFVEVELTGLPGRVGVRPDELFALVASVGGQPHLRLRGLMTMAAMVEDPELARPTFAKLRELRDQVEQEQQIELPELSMGMSRDFAVAIEEGATVVRIGRALESSN